MCNTNIHHGAQADAPTFSGEGACNLGIRFSLVRLETPICISPLEPCNALDRADGFVAHTLQTRIKVGEDPLPENADLVLIDAQEEALSADAWADLVRPLVQVRAHVFLPVSK